MTFKDQLKVFTASTKDEIAHYKCLLSEINGDWPYYRFELLNVKLNEDFKLMFFVFYRDDKPVVLMPFYNRNIVINGRKTQFFDVTSPWGYTGPLYRGAIDEDIARSYWKKVDTWYQDNSVVTEFVRFNFLKGHLYYSGQAVHTLFNVCGRLVDDEKIWENIQSKTKNKIRNAYKNGLDFTMFQGEITPEKVQEFYDIYISTMDRNSAIKSFYHDINYFQEFVRNNLDCCAIGLVYKDNKAISTELFLINNTTIFSFLGGTISDYFHLRPNDFLKMETIKWARDKGLEYYVIGGGLKDDDSLYQYKKKFFRFDEDLSFYTGRKIIDLDAYNELVGMALGDQAVIIDSTDSISDGFFPKYRMLKV